MTCKQCGQVVVNLPMGWEESLRGDTWWGGPCIKVFDPLPQIE